MRNSLNGHSLAQRLMRLERQAELAPTDQVKEWRAELASCFTAPDYASHREAIIDALCSEEPRYRFTLPGDLEHGVPTMIYLVMWPQHTGVPVTFVLPEPKPEPEE